MNNLFDWNRHPTSAINPVRRLLIKHSLPNADGLCKKLVCNRIRLLPYYSIEYVVSVTFGRFNFIKSQDYDEVQHHRFLIAMNGNFEQVVCAANCFSASAIPPCTHVIGMRVLHSSSTQVSWRNSGSELHSHRTFAASQINHKYIQHDPNVQCIEIKTWNVLVLYEPWGKSWQQHETAEQTH